jgi:predicted DNA-binding protein
MPDELAGRLAVLADRSRTSRSEILRSALERYIDNGAPNAVSPSAFDRLAAIAGTVQGPSDLSTAPRHLEGYGK